MKNRQPIGWIPIILFAGFLALYWLGNGSHGLWDEDEPRYAQATREMLASGNFISPTFNGQDRFQKPVLIYWLMMIPMGLFGENEFTARAVSGVSGALAMALLYLFAVRLGCGRKEAIAVAVMTGLFALVLLISKAAVIDATLLLLVVGIMWLIWEQFSSGFDWTRHFLLWFLLGLSILLKGPPAPMIAATTLLMLGVWNGWNPPKDDHRFGFRLPNPLHWITGILILLAVVLPWGIAIGIQSKGEFYRFAIGNQIGERVTSSMEGHEGPFYFYLIALVLGIFPFTGLALVGMRWVWGQGKRETIRFLWSWLLPSFVIFSAIPTKLPHYIAPLLPAVGLMLGLWLTELSRGRGEVPRFWWRLGGVMTAIIGLLISAGLPTGSLLAEIHDLVLPTLVVGILLLGTCLGGGVLLMRGEPMMALQTLAGGWVVVLLTILLWALPIFDAVRPSRVITRWIRENAPAEAHFFASDYRVSSLPFNHGGLVEMVGNARPKDTVRRMMQEPVWVLTTTRHRWSEWLKEDAEDESWTFPPDIEEKASFHLFFVERGKWQEHVIIGNKWHSMADPETRVGDSQVP
jgi:4-amino-4-deoxy-L-arabinose transferase-like glycosyltransferase